MDSFTTISISTDMSEIDESKGDHIDDVGVLVDWDHGSSNSTGGCVIA